MSGLGQGVKWPLYCMLSYLLVLSVLTAILCCVYTLWMSNVPTKDVNHTSPEVKSPVRRRNFIMKRTRSNIVVKKSTQLTWKTQSYLKNILHTSTKDLKEVNLTRNGIKQLTSTEASRELSTKTNKEAMLMLAQYTQITKMDWQKKTKTQTSDHRINPWVIWQKPKTTPVNKAYYTGPRKIRHESKSTLNPIKEKWKNEGTQVANDSIHDIFVKDENNKRKEVFMDNRDLGGEGVFTDNGWNSPNVYSNGTSKLYHKLPPVYWYCKNNYCFKTNHGEYKDRYKSWAKCTLLCMGAQIWPYPTGYTRYNKHIVGISEIVYSSNLEGEDDTALSHIVFTRYNNLRRVKKDSDAYAFGDEYPKPHFIENLKRAELKVHIETDLTSHHKLETDESYSLKIKPNADVLRIYVNSFSYVGAKHAIETLFQIFLMDDTIDRIITLSKAIINDSPSYKYRGLMIDTGRNYIHLNDIEDIIETMSICKMNMLHWRISSDTSFPWASEELPLLFEYGAYSIDKKYSSDDIERIGHYARLYGIRLVLEVATPGPVGRAWSWLPEAVCSKQKHHDTCDNVLCTRLPMMDLIYDKLEKIYREINSLVSKNYYNNMTDIFHLSNGLFSIANCYELLNDRIGFLEEALSRLKNIYGGILPQLPFIWYTPDLMSDENQDLWETFGVHIYDWDWNVARQDYSAFRVIFTGRWDLTYKMRKMECEICRTWQEMYSWTEWRNVKAYSNEGGEATLWTDRVSSANIYSTIWPRAAAVAERLWSDSVINATVDANVYVRLDILRWKVISQNGRPNRRFPAPIWPEMCLLSPGACALKIKPV